MFEMKKPECLRYHIWLRVRQFLDHYYGSCADETGEPSRCNWIITNIFFQPTDVVVHYLDPSAVRLKDKMTGGAYYFDYDKEPELQALKEMADYLARLSDGPPAGTPVFGEGGS